MSLYEDALVEAKKLKEIAEADAKRAIVEDITPFIRKMIASELAGKTVPLYEEDDKSLMGGVDAAPVADPAGPVGGGDAPGAPSLGGDASGVPGAVVGGPMDAPIKVTGADSLNMPMPGPDGKLVVDFDDMFVPSEPGDDSASGEEGAASAATPPSPPGGLPSTTPVDVNPAPSSETGDAPAPGADVAASPAGTGALTPNPTAEPQMETYEMFAESLDEAARKVHKAYSSEGVPSLVKEALQEKLFVLVENLERLHEKKVISSGLARIFENRLEILHLKLKEAKVGNTYYRTEGTDMASKSLKEFAAKMLAESDTTVPGGDVTSPADVHKTEKSMTVNNAEDKAADKAGTHAQKVTEPTVTLKTEAAELAKLEEELTALISESEGESLSADDGKQSLAGAASSIPDKKVGEVDVTKSTDASPTNPASHVQGVSENIEHSKETGSEEVVDKTSTGHPVKKESVAVSKKALAEQTKKVKAEALQKQIKALQEQLKECGMEMEANGLPAPGVPAKKSVMGEEDVVVNFNFDLADLVPELSGLGDDDEIEITDDGDDDDLGALSAGPSAGGSEEELPMDLGAGAGGEEKPEEEEGGSMPLSERIRRGAGPAARKTLAENKALKAQLAEQTLFNAKVVHLQPFMNNKNLTKEQKQKIVEYLDRGKSVDEVKTIYTKVKTVLENAAKAKAKAGSSSKPAGAGAATLNESADKSALYEGAVLVEAERNRLMELAGIKRK
jgi:hypothetical protein